MTLWQNGTTNRDHAALRRPPALQRPLSGGTATWRVLKNAVWFEHGVRTHIDRCCRLPSSPPANTDHTHASGYYRLGGVRQHKNTTAHNAHSFFFLSFFAFTSWLILPLLFAESSGTKYELTGGNGVTGAARQASEAASEGGFIYSGEQPRGWALHRRC